MDGLPVLLLGLALGAVHALDADHIMAVSLLNSRRVPLWRLAGSCMYWACGHSAVLMALFAALALFGAALPPVVQSAAELAVGVLLVGLGLAMLILGRGISLHSHSHGGLRHIHLWRGPHRGHASLLVGALHGLAGGAPLLALVPGGAANGWGLGYIALFCIGMSAAMITFGVGFGTLAAFLRRRGMGAWVPRSVAMAAVAVGGYWLAAAW